MPKLMFDELEKRTYETGISNVALYVSDDNGWYKDGVAWNGVSKINEQPEGGEITPIYADNIKYLSLLSAVNMKFSLECYTYPDEFAVCDGSASLEAGVSVAQQPKSSFALAYLTNVGSEQKSDLGEKLHILYGCKASPAERAYETINNDPSAISFSFSGECTPVPVLNHKPTALITVDSTKLDKAKYEKIKEFVYGSNSANAKLPKPEEIAKLAKGETI